jgi:hypothetical protein
VSKEGLITDLRRIIITGATISYLDSDCSTDIWRVIGSTGNIVKLVSGSGSFQLLSFAVLARFAAEGRLVVDGVPYNNKRGENL